MNKEVMFSSATDMWATPQDFFDALDHEFHFVLDVCATPENNKCERYFSPAQDGLAQDWGKIAGGGVLLVQPALRARSREVGTQGSGKRLPCRHAATQPYRYGVVS